MKFATKSLAALKGVHPDLVLVLTTAILDTPVDFTIIEGVRSLETQRKYYTWGRTVINPNTGPRPGKPYGDIITKADGVHNVSNHQVKADGYGHAVDLYPYINGAIDFNDRAGKLKLVAAHIKHTANRLDIAITWGGDWTIAKEGIIDKPHFQLR